MKPGVNQMTRNLSNKEPVMSKQYRLDTNKRSNTASNLDRDEQMTANEILNSNSQIGVLPTCMDLIPGAELSSSLYTSYNSSSVQTSHKLLFPVPVVNVKSLEHAHSKELCDFGLSQPVCIFRNLCRVINLDLSMFSSKCLMQHQPDHEVEIRIQKKPAVMIEPYNWSTTLTNHELPPISSTNHEPPTDSLKNPKHPSVLSTNHKLPSVLSINHELPLIASTNNKNLSVLSINHEILPVPPANRKHPSIPPTNREPSPFSPANQEPASFPPTNRELTPVPINVSTEKNSNDTININKKSINNNNDNNHHQHSHHQQKRSWYLESRLSTMTISKYADYQAITFIEAQRRLRQSAKSGKGRIPRSLASRNKISFGTNVDLSNQQIWKKHLDQLQKLPAFLKVDCKEENMLNWIGHKVLGVNTVQLYMKIPGCRTPGHQENNNFSAVNVNIGPGYCEWFCIPGRYWNDIKTMCQKHGIDFLSGSWWPNLEDLSENCIPLYHVVQQPGDLVWIGPATIHWVQSLGWCNNIAWNVGPMKAEQYLMAIERYQDNWLPRYKSIIPLVQLTWNIAKSKVRLKDNRLYYLLRRTMRASLRQIQVMKNYAASKMKKEIIRQERLNNDLAHYCQICQCEVFDILFVSRTLVYCFNCSIGQDPSLKDYYILEEYSIKRLANIYDSFRPNE